MSRPRRWTTTRAKSFLRLLMQECAAHGTTLLFVSHDPTLGALFDRQYCA